MIKIILIMSAGIGTGYLLRCRDLRHLGKVISVLIWLLLFLLGVEVGGDERIVKGIGTLGLEALAISVAGVAGCASLALALWKYASRRGPGPHNEAEGGKRKGGEE